MEENTAKTMIPDNTPYDKAFKGLLMDCRKLILPVLNEAFGEHYNGDEEIVFTQNEQIYPAEDGKRKRRFTDTSFMVTSHNNIIKRYHLEAESNTDNTILLRLFEYDIKYAFDQTRKITGRILEVSLPNTALLYLRSDPSTPDSLINRFRTPTGVFSYEIPVIKMKSYTLDEIFEKKLYFLLPFYIFNRENRFPEYEKDPVLRKQFLKEISDILGRLNDLEKKHLLTSHEMRVIIESMEYVAANLTAKYTLVGKEVNEIMVGPGEALEFKATQILNEGIAIGREEGEIIGTIKAYAKVKASPSQIVKSIMDDYGLKQKEAEKYVEETLNIVKA